MGLILKEIKSEIETVGFDEKGYKSLINVKQKELNFDSLYELKAELANIILNYDYTKISVLNLKVTIKRSMYVNE